MCCAVDRRFEYSRLGQKDMEEDGLLLETIGTTSMIGGLAGQEYGLPSALHPSLLAQ